ncbi:hypothetical protein [Treponema primitia]|uniref:hypothetical protein n=1 Tax=Treponema primitia TaxID=88058 RepID=UPI00025557E4|nr:hypothetical protein [Treponema primitia]
MKKKQELNYKRAIIATIFAIIIFGAISVIFGIMPWNVLPANYMGAALGALIGALITLVLLKGQTAVEEQKGKDIRILERKIDVFQNYIKDVWKVWEASITIEIFRELTLKYYQDLMMYLDNDQARTIGDALTDMGKRIQKSTFDDTEKVHKEIVLIINTLIKEIDLGGEIIEDIMEEHDIIVFPHLFRNSILDKLNEALKVNDETSIFNEGKYEPIRENDQDREFIAFEMKKFSDVFLSIWVGGDVKKTEMAFMASDKLDAEFYRRREHPGKMRYRFGNRVDLSVPIPNDEDNTAAPLLDFNNVESIKVFRKKKRDFPSTLAKRVLYRLVEWKEENLGIVEFFEKKLGQEEAK